MKLLGMISLAVIVCTSIGVLERVYGDTRMLNDNKCEIAYENYQDAKKLDNDAALNDVLAGAESINCDTSKW